MKTKIIAIVIAFVITAGTATGVGVAVKQSNDKNTEELVSLAVSEALATTEETTTEVSTTEQTTIESTTLRDAKLPARTTTTINTANTTTGNNGTKTIINDEKKYADTAKKQVENEINNVIEIDTPLGRIKKNNNKEYKDAEGYYWDIIFTNPPDTSYNYFIDENNKLFYFNDNRERIYYSEQN